MFNFKHGVGLSLVLCCVASATPAFAGPIVYFDEFRAVTVSQTGESSTNEGHFQAAYAVTSPRFAQGANGFQDSLIDPFFAGGIGDINSGNPFGSPIDARSTYSTSFALDQFYQAELTVELLATGSGNAFVTLSNIGAQQDLLLRSTFSNGEVATFSGILGPGSYRLLLGARTTGEGIAGQPYFATARFDGGLGLRPLDAASVPEPASMTMLALGLIGAGVHRIRSRRKTNRRMSAGSE